MSTNIYNYLCYPHGDRLGLVVVVGVGIEGKSDSGGTEARIGKQIIYSRAWQRIPARPWPLRSVPTWPVRAFCPSCVTGGLGARLWSQVLEVPDSLNHKYM